MKARPILFSGAMIRALLAGTKTQTRRTMKPQPDHLQVHTHKGKVIYDGEHRMWCWNDLVLENIWDFPGNDDRHQLAGRCPYGVPGDLLWVRESGELAREAYDHNPTTGQDEWCDAGFVHAADGAVVEARAYDPPLREWFSDCALRPRPSIHMPRWASRLTLEISEVRVERLQDISEEDAIAEGSKEPSLVPLIGACWSERDAYAKLWEHINGKGSWAANPWCWAVSFAVHHQNIDAYLNRPSSEAYRRGRA